MNYPDDFRRTNLDNPAPDTPEHIVEFAEAAAKMVMRWAREFMELTEKTGFDPDGDSKDLETFAQFLASDVVIQSLDREHIDPDWAIYEETRDEVHFQCRKDGKSDL